MEIKQCVVKLFALTILLIVTHTAIADDQILFDYSDDFFSYAQMVAQLNQEQKSVHIKGLESSTQPSFEQLTALLCRTDGQDIDFDDLSASFIIAGPKNCYTLFFSSRELCLSAAQYLKNSTGVIYAEPDCEVHANNISNQVSSLSIPVFHSWGASRMNIAHYIQYASAWGNGSATIAVVDSGVFPHALIQGKLLASGYDYVDGDEDSTNDPFGHGTNVAGVIADCTVGEPVYICPIRVLSGNGSGKMSNVVNAVREATNRGVTIINLSLESSVMSDALDDAILEAISSGITVVVAAGNSSCNTSQVCPAHLTNAGVIVVGAVDGIDGKYTIASYSNYGQSIDIYAFGTGISCCSNSGGYSKETGTSIAAPHISALCALMYLVHPGISPQQLEKRLQLASLGEDLVIVPDSLLMIPMDEGFFLSEIRMNIHEHLTLPSMALPLSSCEVITYTSSDEQIVVVSDGIMEAKGYGTAIITVSCKGFDETTFLLVVDDYPNNTVSFPNSIEYIEDEAFYGTTSLTQITIPVTVRGIGNYVFDKCESLRWIHIPETVTSIGKNTFSSAIILCSQNSRIHSFAVEQNLQYIALK